MCGAHWWPRWGLDVPRVQLSHGRRLRCNAEGEPRRKGLSNAFNSSRGVRGSDRRRDGKGWQDSIAIADNNRAGTVYVFTAPRAAFPEAVFSSREAAGDWIEGNGFAPAKTNTCRLALSAALPPRGRNTHYESAGAPTQMQRTCRIADLIPCRRCSRFRPSFPCWRTCTRWWSEPAWPH